MSQYEPGQSTHDPAVSLADAAEIGNLAAAITTVLTALEQFIRFDTPEQTSRQRAVWEAQLDEPLPPSWGWR